MTLNRWMSTLHDQRELREICMPGSHDACMYECSPGNEGKVDATVTQFHTIREQLDLGARFFDIRVYLDGKTLRPGHFMAKDKSDSFGSYGPPFDTVLSDLANFMGDNPSEVLILKFSTSTHAHPTAIGEIESMLGDFLFTSQTPKNLACEKLGDLRGKILAVFDQKEGKRGRLHVASKTLPPAAKATLGSPGEPSMLWLHGEAPTANSIKEVVEKQLKAAEPCGGLAPHLEMRYLTITASRADALRSKMSVVDNTAREFRLNLAPRPQRHALQSIYGSWASGEMAKNHYWEHAVASLWRQNQGINIFMYDFVNRDVNEMLIKLNDVAS